MTPALLIALALGCSGTLQEPEAPPPTPEIDPSPAPTIECGEGTTLEKGVSSKGVEYWCDRDGVMHGSFVRFHHNDRKAVSGEYNSNQPNGNWTWWHETGHESKKGKYVRGKQTGAWTWWHEGGERAREGDFLAGRKAGQWTAWFPSGVKQEEGMFHNDMKNALWTFYNDDDQNSVARTELWRNGEMVEEKVQHVRPRQQN